MKSFKIIVLAGGMFGILGCSDITEKINMVPEQIPEKYLVNQQGLVVPTTILSEEDLKKPCDAKDCHSK